VGIEHGKMADCSALEGVTAVIVTFNSAHCAEALGVQLADWPHVIVVDNGSADDTPARMRAALPQAQVLELGENRGFGAANNAALHQVQTPYALLMNPDCAVMSADAQALLASMAQWPQAAIMAPQLVDGRGDKQVNYGWVRHQWNSQGPAAEGVTCVGNACGAAMLLRLEAMPTRDWFDTRFFLYYEDEDLCLRLLKAGKPVMIEPAVRVAHANRGSVRGPRPLKVEFGRGYHHARSKVLFTAKHLGAADAARHRRRALWGAVGLLVLRVLVPSPKHVARVWGRVVGLWSAPVTY
jgi:GT2 family glycosyltransferase